jgi:hypothetical protein
MHGVTEVTRDEREAILDEAYPTTWPMEYGSKEEAMALAAAELDAEEAQRGWTMTQPHTKDMVLLVLGVVLAIFAAAIIVHAGNGGFR